MQKLGFLVFMLMTAPAFAASHSSGMGWFGQRFVSALIHGVIYGIIFKIFRSLGLVPSIIVGAVILGGAYLYYKRKGGN